MIRLVNVNKYFNRFRKNQIHVINNTSLEFEDTGLVALLGESGCGKTTLLNAIGGLNKINSGKIYINGKKLPRKSGYFKDRLRTLNIGYIFQNYNLIDDMTVYDNIALSLRMIGIKNKKEIKKRVDYVLEKTRMYRYRNRLAGALSGGQRQRVGIARAIVKNPSVIIADEPTGNLDSKNTIEIMNIIKSISKEKLVILVTHEKDLAYFYASRIIDLEDGKVINSRENEHSDELDYRMDNKIYLKDFDNKDSVNKDNYSINLYSSNDDNINIDVIVKNGNIYIRSNDYKKIEVVDDDSSIELINDSYRKIKKDDYESTNFDLKELDNSKMRIHYASIYNIISTLKVGINRVLNYPLLKKILLFGFFTSSMFILYSISNIFGVTRIEDKDFIATNKNYLYINDKGTIDKYNSLAKNDIVKYVIPGDSMISLLIDNNSLYQFKNTSISISGSLSGISLITEDDLVLGRMPTSEKEIVIDKMVIDRAKENMGEVPSMIGIIDYNDYIGLNLKAGDLTYTIVGISDLVSPSIYMDEDNFITLLNNKNNNDYLDESNEKFIDYSNVKINLKKGKMPSNDYEVIVNQDNSESMPLNKEINVKINNHKLKVVGYYFDPYGENNYYVNSNMILMNVLKDNNGYSIIANNKDECLNLLQQAGYNVKDSYNADKTKYLQERKDSVRNSLIIAGILLAISFVEIFLMIRASFMSRVKEVGILRSIGIRKIDIYKMFMGEILIITTITAIPGVILMSSILNEVTKISFISSQFLINKYIIILSFIIIYALNLMVGLLPIRNIIRKEPADILARNDVD